MGHINRLNRFVFPFILASIYSLSLFADELISVNSRNGITIGGYDTVAYHDTGNTTHHKAVKGKKALSVEWMGAVWQFSTENNRDLFLNDPNRFRPAYGGHCANALSIGDRLNSNRRQDLGNF